MPCVSLRIDHAEQRRVASIEYDAATALPCAPCIRRAANLHQRRFQPPPRRPLSSRAFAILTFNARPLNSRPSNCLIAFCASESELISTKPNPRDWPLNLSVMTDADSHMPASANSACRSFSVTSNPRLPTYSFFPILRAPLCDIPTRPIEPYGWTRRTGCALVHRMAHSD